MGNRRRTCVKSSGLILQPQPAFVDNEVKRIFSCSLNLITSKASILFLVFKIILQLLFFRLYTLMEFIIYRISLNFLLDQDLKKSSVGH
ncbi:hypothetical protein UB32_18130 [Mesobacillus subterraneus]|uniref:Uncharacterized protein n=1 Tax=Mesobacillus subterraneus TaxID=285983 RepID=A0A0D6Z4L0_9BACI|nr:hypothetical protein UB32_18130 [Mesobacillus subterraneus]